MPAMRARVMKPKPIAVACSDLHLTLQTPACRKEQNWLEVQIDYLGQLRGLASDYKVPVICAGDIFDRWNPPPELIRFALIHLPEGMLCVPGQHDLPNHSMDQKHRSGYGVLAEAHKIVDLSEEEWLIPSGMAFVAYGFGWGQEILPPSNESKGIPHIAVIHRYCWAKGCSFPGATEDTNVNAYTKELQGYDVAVFGDNHKGFLANRHSKPKIVNCGTFIRRKADEIMCEPAVMLIYDDGSVKTVYLKTDRDQFHDNAKEREKEDIDLRSFMQNLEELGEQGMDFREAVKRYLDTNEVKPNVRKIILTALGQ